MTEGLTRIAVPNKGRLSDPSVELLRQAGIAFEVSARALSIPALNMPVEILFVRAEDIPELVHRRVVQFGITGLDLVAETALDVILVAELGFGRCKLTAAVENTSEIYSIEQFDGLRVATSHPTIVSTFFAEKDIAVTTVPLNGSVEVAPKLDIADAVVDLMSSGSTMTINGLRTIATVLESQAALISSDPMPDSPIPTMVKAVVSARRKRYVVLNAPAEAIAEIERIIPGSESPTVVPLRQSGKFAVHSVVDAQDLWKVLPQLESAGASSILVLPISQMIA